MSQALPRQPGSLSPAHQVQLPTGQLTVEGDPLALESLCGFGARNNPNRGFLFVSKVLGKHWPCNPRLMLATHQALADQASKIISGPACFIGMAETATGLGQGIFESYLAQGGQNSCFVHTTRYRLNDYQPLVFVEPHSHAPTQWLHCPATDQPARVIFDGAQTLVLIDDEITTGTTLQNLSDAYLRYNPQVKQILWLCLTNFSDRRQTTVNGVPVEIISLYQGSYRFQPDPALAAIPLPNATGNQRPMDGLVSTEFGRVGITERIIASQEQELDHFAHKFKAGQHILILGTGEFVHPAFKLALQLQKLVGPRGVQVHLQSTTRSPALIGHDITSVLQGPDFYGEDVPTFLYNVRPERYDEIVLCPETRHYPAISAWAERLGSRHIWFLKDESITAPHKE